MAGPVRLRSSFPPIGSKGDIPPGCARFVTDVEDCVREARAAAGDRAVMVHEAGAAQEVLRAGLLDEFEIHRTSVQHRG
jgi:hypothetical protein